jgi:hypothetical protein
MHRFSSFLILFLALLTGLLASDAMAVGESVAPSLIIPPGARANGMGESYVALSNDATAAWWNPGALAYLQGNNIAFMHSQLVPDLASDVYYEFFGYAKSIEGVGTVAFSFNYLTYGELIGKLGPDAPEVPFHSWEGALMASYGMNLGKNIGVGLSMKYIYADYAPPEVTPTNRKGAGASIAVDVGTLWKMPRWKTQVGASLTNIGPDINFEDKEQPNHLPTIIRVGASIEPLSDEISNLLFAFEIEQSLLWLIYDDIDVRRSEIWHAGAEYTYIRMLAGRIGYIYDKDGHFNSATYGMGFMYKNFEFDYANIPQAVELERVHRWSLTVNF